MWQFAIGPRRCARATRYLARGFLAPERSSSVHVSGDTRGPPGLEDARGYARLSRALCANPGLLKARRLGTELRAQTSIVRPWRSSQMWTGNSRFSRILRAVSLKRMSAIVSTHWPRWPVVMVSTLKKERACVGLVAQAQTLYQRNGPRMTVPMRSLYCSSSVSVAKSLERVCSLTSPIRR